MTEDQIKSIIAYAIEEFASEWAQHDSGQNVADAIDSLNRRDGNIVGIANGLHRCGSALESIANTYRRELEMKMDGEIQ
jgi:hypothetical protein